MSPLTLVYWEAEACFRRARIRVHRRTHSGGRGVTDGIGRAELELAFNAWEWILCECIQMKDESITQGRSKVLVEIHILVARLRC
jgi:hypothetical protein